MSDVELLVRVAGLTQYDRDRLVLDSVRFEAAPGSLFVLYGASGSGKSTLLAILAGIQAYTAGTVETCGQTAIGFVPQDGGLFPNLKVSENLQAVGMIRGMDARELHRRIEESLASLGLADVRRERARRLPWGMRGRLALACALLGGPRLLLVDDILSRGDPVSSRLIVESVRRYVADGGACVWCTARPAEAVDLAAGGAARLAALEGGRLTVYEDAAAFEQGLRDERRCAEKPAVDGS